MTLDTPPGASDRRWLQRFDNPERALKQLAAAIDAHQVMPENGLMVIAMIKTDEVCFDLGWTTLKDLLAWNGIDARLPREVLKQAFAAGLIENGQRWIDRLEERNLLAALDDLPTPYLFDVTHWESTHHPGLRDHIEHVGRVFP